MKTISTCMWICVLIVSFSFTISDDRPKTAGVAGKYGVCSYAEAPAQEISVELTLNPDNTFHYIDNSNTENKIDVSGKWTLYEGDIYLTDYPTGKSIHKIWKTEKDSSCLKSRKGMTYYRLCKI